MDPVITILGNCEVCGVIHFVQVEGHIATKIHYRLCHVCGDNFVNDGSVRDCCKKFTNGCTDVNDKREQGDAQL